MQKLKLMLLFFVGIFTVVGVKAAEDFSLAGVSPLKVVEGWQVYAATSDTLKAQKLFSEAAKENPESFVASSSYAQLYSQQAKDHDAAKVLMAAMRSGKWDLWAEPALADMSSFYTDLTPEEYAEIGKIYQGRLANPEISWLEKALITVELQSLSYMNGDYKTRREIFARQPYITSFLIAGPFSNRNREGFEKQLPLESELSLPDLEKSYQGRGRNVGWFEYTAPYDGRVDLEEVLSPGSESMAYVCTYVTAKQDMSATLDLDQSGASELWLNGVKVYRDGKYVDGDGSLQRLIGIRLHKGVNQIVLKIAGDYDVDAAFSMRIVPLAVENIDRKSSAKESENNAGLIEYPGMKSALKDYAQREIKSIEGNLAENVDGSFGDSGIIWGARKEYLKLLEKNPRHPLALLNMSYLNSEYGVDDDEYSRTLSYDEKLVEAYPGCSLFLSSLAQSQSDENKERRLLEKAFKLAPLEYSYQDTLLSNLYSSGFSEQAKDKANEILKIRDSYTAHKILAEYYRKLEWYEQARAEYQKCLALYPGSDSLVVDISQMMSGSEETLSYLKSMLKTHGARVHSEYAERLYKDNKFREALDIYLRLVGENCYWKYTWIVAAECAAAMSDFQQAAQILTNAMRWMPQSAQLLEKIGRYHLQAGDKKLALDFFHRSLETVSDNPELQAYVKQLKPKIKSFYSKEMVSLSTLKGRDKTTADYPEFDQIFLLDQGYVYVLPNGSARRMYRAVSKVLREKAISGASKHEIYFSASSQKAEVVHARVIQPDGSVIEAAEIDEYEYGSNNSASSVYGSGGMVKTIKLSQVKVGSIVDVAWTVEDIGEPLYGNNFYDMFFFGAPQPTLNFRYAAEFPESLLVRYAVTPGCGYEPEVSDKDSYKRLSWSESDIPGIKSETSMPPFSEIKPYLSLSSFSGWKELGEWAWRLFEPQMVLSSQMKDKVAELIKGKATREEKIKAVYDFIIGDIRYVSISYGRFGYTPHKVKRTFNSRYGDCKDTAALFVALLREAGVKAYPALVRAREAGIYKLDLPSPLIYNHAIAYAPAEKEGDKSYWLDGTTDYFSFGMIPSMDRGTEALVFGSDNGEVLLIDPSKPDMNLKSSKIDIQLARGGSGTVSYQQRNRGEAAMALFRAFERPKAFEYMLKNYSGKRYAGGNLITFGKVECDGDDSCGFELKIKSPTIANNVFGQFKLMPLYFPLDISGLAMLAERKYDLMLGAPSIERMEVSLTLPEGATLITLPQDKDLSVAAASFRLKASSLDRVVKIVYEFTILKDRVTVSEYQDFRKFCNAVTAAAAEMLTYKD